jgi:lipopolysaccharide/colanic/teichoic acid biosynthesis glycosyltransferase
MINARIACAALGVPPCAVSDNQLSRHVQEEGVSPHMRRLGDIVIACLLLAITSPLMLVVALAIKLEGGGPFLDRQNCIGCSGRRFQALKFRTAVHDPQHATPTWAQRTTQVGEFLRYTRIEDLPQLINVLRGEMSIIDRDARSVSFLD